MSRAYEASLTNQLARIDRLIAESQLLASRSSDEETLRYLEEDLMRWRELRTRYVLSLSRTKAVNRVASWTLWAFGISFTALLAIAFLGIENPFSAPLLAVDLLLLIGCGATYIVAILVRDAVAHGRQPWSFSLRSLLAGMTIIAVLLGLLAYELRK